MIFIAFSFGQNFEDIEDQIKYADKLFDKNKFAEAQPHFANILSKNQLSHEFQFKFGACLLHTTTDKNEALGYLRYASKGQKVSPKVFFYLGIAQHLTYQFKHAKNSYEKFQALGSKKDLEDSDVDRRIEQCENGLQLMSNLSEIIVREKKTVRTSRLPYSYDLTNIGGKILITDEFQSSLDRKRNHRPVVHFPASRQDVIVYSSFGKSGKTGKDLYQIYRTADGGWSDPIPLPEHINTPYDDDFGYLHPDGETFYFCSKGHNSMGGYDVFKTTVDIEANQFGTPENLDFKINSPDDDILFIVDSINQSACFASARAAKSGDVDVYYVGVKTVPILNTIIAGQFFNDIDQGKSISRFTVKSVETQEIIGEYESESNGDYFILLPRSGKYEFYVTSPNNESVHKGTVDVPYLDKLRPLKQELRIIHNGSVEQLVIRNLFEDELENSDEIVAKVMNMISNPEVNVDTYVVPEKEKEEESEISSKEALSDEEILSKGEAIVESISKEAITANFNLVRSFNMAKEEANKSNDLAGASKEILSEQLGKSGEGDQLRSSEQLKKALSLQEEAKEAKSKAEAALSVASILKIEQDKASLTASIAQEMSSKVKAAIDQGDRSKAIEILEQMESMTNSGSSSGDDVNRKGVAELVMDSAKAQQIVVDKLIAQVKEIRLEQAEVIQEKGELRRKLNLTRKEKEKVSLQQQIDQLSEDIELLNPEIEDLSRKAEKEQVVANKLKVKSELITSLYTEVLDQNMDSSVAKESLSKDDQLEIVGLVSDKAVESTLKSNDEQIITYQSELSDFEDSGNEVDQEAEFAANEGDLEGTTQGVSIDESEYEQLISLESKIKEMDDKLEELENLDDQIERSTETNKIYNRQILIMDEKEAAYRKQLASADEQTKRKIITRINKIESERNEKRQLIAANDELIAENIGNNKDEGNDLITDNLDEVIDNDEEVKAVGSSADDDISLDENLSTDSGIANPGELDSDEVADDKENETIAGFNEGEVSLVEDAQKNQNAEIESDNLGEHLSADNGQQKINDDNENSEENISNDETEEEGNNDPSTSNSQSNELAKVDQTTPISPITQEDIEIDYSKPISFQNTEDGMVVSTDQDELDQYADLLNKRKDLEIQLDSETKARTKKKMTKELVSLNNEIAKSELAIGESISKGVAGEIDALKNEIVELEFDNSVGSSTADFKAEAYKQISQAQQLKAEINGVTNNEEKVEMIKLVNQKELAGIANLKKCRDELRLSSEQLADDLEVDLIDSENEVLESDDPDVDLSEKGKEEVGLTESLDLVDVGDMAESTDVNDLDDEENTLEENALIGLNDKADDENDSSLDPAIIDSLGVVLRDYGVEVVVPKSSYEADIEYVEFSSKIDTVGIGNLNYESLSSQQIMGLKAGDKLEIRKCDLDIELIEESLMNYPDKGVRRKKRKIRKLKKRRTKIELNLADNVKAANRAEIEVNSNVADARKNEVENMPGNALTEYLNSGTELTQLAQNQEEQAKELRSTAAITKDKVEKAELLRNASDLEHTAAINYRKASVVYQSVAEARLFEEYDNQDQISADESLRKSTRQEILREGFASKATVLNTRIIEIEDSLASDESADKAIAQIEIDKLNGQVEFYTYLASLLEENIVDLKEHEANYVTAKSSGIDAAVARQMRKNGMYQRYFDLMKSGDSVETVLRTQRIVLHSLNTTRRDLQTTNADSSDNELLSERLGRQRDSVREIVDDLLELKADNISAKEEYLTSAKSDDANKLMALTYLTDLEVESSSKELATIANKPSDKLSELFKEEVKVQDASITYSDDNPIPINPKMPDGLVYRVQIGAFRKEIDPNLFDGFAPLTGEQVRGGITRYRVGFFSDVDGAVAAKNQIKQLENFADAFVVVMYNGEKISFAEAREIQDREQNMAAANVVEKDDQSGLLISSVLDRAELSQINEVTSTEELPQTSYYDDVSAAPAVQVEEVKGLFYAVQFVAVSKPMTSNQIRGIAALNTELAPNGLIRYSSGMFNSVSEAVVRKEELQGLGYPDAFVTPYYDGKRITFKRSKELENLHGNSIYAGKKGNKKESNTAERIIPGLTFEVLIGVFTGKAPTDIANAMLKDQRIKAVSLGGQTSKYIAGYYSKEIEAARIQNDMFEIGLIETLVIPYFEGNKISDEEKARITKANEE